MTTVPKAGEPAPPNNAKTTLLSGSAGMYGRPASGGPPVAGKQEGNAPVSDAPAGPTPGYSINNSGGAPVTTGGPNVGHGATQIVAQPDATGAPETATDGGTVGTSQGGPHS
jgi:hypothetical protein